MNILRFIVPKSLVQTVSHTSTVRQALEIMKYHRYTALPVLDGEGRYLGTVRNTDIFAYYFDRQSPKDTERDSIMSMLDPHYQRPIRHDATMTQLIDEVKEHNFVPVVDDRGCFIGIILRREILSFLMSFYHE